VKLNRTLWILAVVCVIDSMGFGVMIPLIVKVTQQVGAGKTAVGFLTAAFSIAQFFATPVLGKLSDKWGRKPLLVICLIGTSISFVWFGLAGRLLMLFAARLLDGATGGDISVAQAMVSDISSPAERSKNFGILGSAFGFGYVIGPAIGGLLSKYGLTVPFFFAGALSLAGAALSFFYLKETHQKSDKAKDKPKAFKYKSLLTVLKRPVIGPVVLIGFFLTMAQFAMLIGFQTYSAEVLKLSPFQVGLFYAGFGVTGILMQLAVPLIQKLLAVKPILLLISSLVCLGGMVICGVATEFIHFAIGVAVYGLFNGLRNPMLNAIIADCSDPAEQGEIMGINQSYTSLGQTFGPLGAGLAILVSFHAPFYLAGLLILAAMFINWRLLQSQPVH
jgi:MFS family permease